MRRVKNVTRRNFLRLCGAAGVSAAVLPSAGCRGDDAEMQPRRIALADLPQDRRVQIVVRRRPVAVLRTASGVSAMSLVCTHMGCTLRWRDNEQLYCCPCHEGRFDAGGEVVGGPPTRHLEVLNVQLDGDHVVVG